MPRWSLEALFDTREILEFLSQFGEASAQRTVDRIIVAANRLDQFPRFGRSGPEEGMRQLMAGRTTYKIYYRLLENGEPEILRILHGARKWPPS